MLHHLAPSNAGVWVHLERALQKIVGLWREGDPVLSEVWYLAAEATLDVSVEGLGAVGVVGGVAEHNLKEDDADGPDVGLGGRRSTLRP